MKHSIAIVLALGLGLQARAEVNSVDRSKRNFRLDPSTGVVYADLVVAYQDVPSFVSLGGKTTSQFLQSAFQDASLALFTASKGAVQLGHVTVIPASIASSGSVKADPDVVIMADQTATTCPANLYRPEEVKAGGVPICADAHTGGYLGLAWWLPTTTITGVTGPVFPRSISGASISSQGARIGVGWNTLATYGAKVLVHEFGHYLFAMRDEYEGPIFQDLDSYEAANGQDPTTHAGIALVGGDASTTPSQWLFSGYGMGLVSTYSASNGYSPKDLLAQGTGAAGWVAFPGELEEKFVATEQTASLATRRAVGSTTRGGGMWSLETAIRTGLNATSTTAVNYTPVVLPSTAHNTAAEAQVDVYGAGQANIFVYDRSGSMDLFVDGDNGLNVTRSDAAIDFFGRLTHPEALDKSNTLKYPANAKFGFVDFDDLIEEPVVYPATIDALKAFTVSYAPASGTTSKQLTWMSASSPSMPLPRGMTDIVDALEQARIRLDGDPQRPFQRNVILISDGMHNWPDATRLTGDEGMNGKYRVFAVSVDTKLDDANYGTTMQNLALRSAGPEGAHGLASYTNGDNTTGQLTQASNDIFNAINQMDLETFSPSQLYRDAAQEFASTTDPGQKTAQFSMSWAGSVAPILYLTLPNGQTLPEGNGTGITFRKGSNFKSFDIDLTKYPLLAGQTTNKWKLRATASTDLPITIFPSLATRSTRLQTSVSFDPRYANATGRLPVTVVVQDGRPIEGLQVNATLTNRNTGVVKSFPLAWNGSAYTGAMAGTLQPGLSDLAVGVVHPNNGKVFFARGENRLPDALRSQYPYFAARQQSQQVWIDGAATAKSIPGLEAWTINTQPNNAQGTTLKLFLKNGTSVPLKGLKARYFYSVSEYANGVPAISTNYLPQSKATVGTVSGRPGLAYVQFDFGSSTLQPGASTSYGTNGGEGLTLIESQWRSPWNTTNDWSAQGLKSTWAANRFVNIYDASGALIAGNPDLEIAGQVGDAQPIVSMVAPSLVAVGIPASFKVNAVDPEGEYLTYTWTVDGVVVSADPAKPDQLVYTFATAGAHTISVLVDDRNSSVVKVSSQVVVQQGVGACTESNSRDLGLASSSLSLGLTQGVNCFVIKDAALVREWKWSKVLFQANSDNGVALTGLSVQSVPVGTATNLTGYSQTVPYTVSTGANLYLKVLAGSIRTVRLNWWLQ